ncbi:MAG: hypothetical protein HYY64_14215 [Candidatus Rokubacteria bacterium]|nr:hypothetical protein [Candidatus Rokubacteria bacterium]
MDAKVFAKGVTVVGMVVPLTVGVCPAQNFGLTGDLLPLVWKIEQAGSEQSRITGSIENRHVFGARGIQLLVEEIDSSGRRVNQAVSYIDRDVPSGGRASFEIRVPTVGGTYRVSLLAIDWFMEGP